MEAPEESGEARRARLRAMRDAASADAPAAPARPLAAALSNPLAEENAAGDAAGALAQKRSGSSFYRRGRSATASSCYALLALRDA